MSRLVGRGRQCVVRLTRVSKLHMWTHPSMADAVRLSRRRIWSGTSPGDRQKIDNIGDRPLDGDALRLKQATDASERLVEEAIAIDQRLARKAQWLRRDEGEHCDAGLLSEGDDQPFYKRTRETVNEAASAGQPVKVFISTDDRNIVPGTAAAFIATARIVRQFMPLEIWWQGAWLTDDKCRGFVFQVPLSLNDGDFSRLEFCLADGSRDMFSWHVMATHAVHACQESWSGCADQASYAYENGGYSSHRFISHTGIKPDPANIAREAARWLGLDPLWKLECEADDIAKSAEQSIKVKEAPYTGYVATAEDKARWAKDERDREAKRRREAEERLAAV